MNKNRRSYYFEFNGNKIVNSKVHANKQNLNEDNKSIPVLYPRMEGDKIISYNYVLDKPKS